MFLSRKDDTPIVPFYLDVEKAFDGVKGGFFLTYSGGF